MLLTESSKLLNAYLLRNKAAIDIFIFYGIIILRSSNALVYGCNDL